jgi:hypothetical protein
MPEGVEIGLVAVSKEVVVEVDMPCVEDQDCLPEDLSGLAPDRLRVLLLRQGQNRHYVFVHGQILNKVEK